MSLILSENNGGSHIEPIEPGTYPALCYGLVDAGDTYNETYDKWSRKVIILWELPGEKLDLGGDEPVSRTISKTYTASLNDKAKLRADLQAWRGRPFTAEELASFDLRTIVGAPCFLNIQQREYKDRTYADVAGIVKLPKGMPVPVGTLEKLVFDLDTDKLSMLEDMPSWIAERIRKSRTYEARMKLETAVPDEARDELFDQIEDEKVPF